MNTRELAQLVRDMQNAQRLYSEAKRALLAKPYRQNADWRDAAYKAAKDATRTVDTVLGSILDGK